MTRFTITVPDNLNQWLDDIARRNNRSKNQQIETILEAARNKHACEDGYHYLVEGQTACACGRLFLVRTE